jgi:uncharacterized protein YnzC (UPF0291/DUF896 family)
MLTLVVNVLGSCKKGVCYPESETEWLRLDIVKVLNLSGIVGELPGEKYTYEAIVRMLIDHLNVQVPKVYALVMDSSVILDSSTVTIRNQMVHVGPYAKIKQVDNLECDHLWSVFHAYVKTRQEYRPPESREVMEKQARIIELQSQINQLTKHIKESNVGRLQSELDEQNTVLRALYRQLQEEKALRVEAHDKNLNLAMISQQSRLRQEYLEAKLQEIRKKLGKLTSSDEDLFETIASLASVKQELQGTVNG